MDFSEIKDGKVRVVYQSVWGHWEKFPENMEIESTSKNDSSYKFKGSKDEACEVIKSIFEIKNSNIFDYQYTRAVSGNG